MKKLLFVSALALGLCVSCSKKAPEQAAPEAGAQQATEQAATFALNVVVEPQDAGTVTPANGAFDKNSAVTLNAVPNANFVFDHWEGDVTGNTPSVQVTIDNNKNIKAVFKAADAAAAGAQQPAAAQPAAQPAAAPAQK